VTDAGQQASEGAYTFRTVFVAAPDSGEPNDRIGQASLIRTSAVSGRIFPRGDQDFHRVYVDADSDLRLELRTPPDMRGQLDLYNPDFGWMGAYVTAANAGDTVHLDRHITAAGFYYLRVRDADGQAHVDEYTLTVTGAMPGHVPVETPVSSEVEGNDNYSQANRISLGASVTGTIQAAGDRDFFTFVPDQVGQVTIAMESAPAARRLRMRLYNDSGTHLMTAQAGLVGGLFQMVFDVTSPDRYYLVVEDQDGEASAETYRFATSIVPVPDPFEPNDDYGDRRPMGEVNRVEAWMFPAGDSDWYQITVSSPGEVEAVLSNLPENITPRIDLFDLSKQHLAGQSGAPGTDLHLRYTVAEPGVYLLVVRDARGNESTQPYTLTVLGADFTYQAPTVSIVSIAPGAIVAGNTVSFQGAGTDADGTVVGYEWTSDIDGLLSTEASFSTSSLSVGTHTISLRVRDDDGIWSTKVTELLYVGSAISEEAEPNHSFFLANEIALNQPVTAKIETSGDEDYFKVYVPGPGRLVAEASNVPTNLRLGIELYNRYWDWLGIYGSAAAVGDNIDLTYDVTEAGWVFLRVRDTQGQANPDFTYTLTVSFHPVSDPFEPNQDLQHAALLPSESVEGLFFPRGDEDWYRVWVPDGGVLAAQVTSVPPGVRAGIDLYGPDREWLGRYQAAVNAGDPVSATAPEAPHAGFYYIRVRTLDGIDWEDTYSLSVTGAQPGYEPGFLPVTAEQEPNDAISLATDLAAGTPVQGHLQPADDADWYRFEVVTPGIIHLGWLVPGNVRGDMRLYRNDGTQLAARVASNPGDPVAFDAHLVEPGFYHLRLRAADGGVESPESYTLTLTTTPVVDVNEPNNRFQDAARMTVLNRAEAYLFPVGDEDWYRVHAQIGSLLRVSVGDVPPAIRPQIEIYDHDGKRLAAKLASNDGQELSLDYEVPATDDYSIRIRDVGNDSFSAEPYTLVIDGAVFDSYVPLAVIDSIEPNPAPPNTPVTLIGHGGDADGEIAGYEWRSSIDGVFSISQVAETLSLSTGVHTIWFRVKDDAGNWSPAVSARLYFGVAAPAEIEPNDVAGAATPMSLDTQYTGDMGRAGDEDWFRVHAPQTGRLTFQVTNPIGSPMRAKVEAYTRDLEWSGVYVTASNDGDPVALVWDLWEPGDYFFRVRDAGNRADGVYAATASFIPVPDPFEPNGAFASAKPIDSDAQVQGWIFPRNDEDWYEVTLPTAGSLRLSLTDVPADLQMGIDVYDADHRWLGVYRTANNAGDDVRLTFDVASPGTYYCRIRAANGGINPTDPYTFSTEFIPTPDLAEPNADALHARWITASPVEGYIFPRGDEDWYRLYVPNGQSLEITADPVPANLRLELTLYNANIDWMGVYPSAKADGDPVTLNLPEAGGVYYLRVRDLDNDHAAGEPYWLSVSGADFDYTPPATPLAAEAEPNNSFPAANFIGTEPVTGVLGGDEDWYRFTVSQPSVVVVQLAVSARHRSLIQVYNGQREQLAAREAENKGDPSRLEFLLALAGEYYLRVSDADGASSEDAYTLDLDLIPAVDANEPNNGYGAATPLVSGTATEGLIFPVGDEDWFSVEVVEPATLMLDLSNVPSNLDMRLYLYDPNGEELLRYDAMHGGDPIHVRRDIEVPGRYGVRVLDRGGDAYALEPYTLTATLVPIADANEPNDSWHEATLLAAANQVMGRIQPVGDADWYRFEVSEPGPVRIQISQTGGINPWLGLYDDSRRELMVKRARNVGDVLELRYDVPSADTYYLLVADDGNDQTSTEGYVVTILGGAFNVRHPMVVASPVFEPNPVQAGQGARLAATAMDEDGFVTAYEWTSDIDGYLGGGNPLDTPALSEGIHHICVRARDEMGQWSGWVEKRLVVAPSLLPESEYNNDASSPMPVPPDQWVVGHINPQGDEDWFKIYVTSCGRVQLLVDAVPPSMRAGVEVFGENGEWLGLSTSARNDGDWIDLGFHANPGWYLVRVRDMDNEPQSGAYAFRWGLEIGADMHEPNGTLAQARAIELNGVITGATICPSGDVDFYRIELEEAGRLQIDLRNMLPTMRGALDLYNADLDWIGVYQTAINGGDPVPLTYDAAGPGVFFVRVKNAVEAATPQPYELATSFTPVRDPYEPNNQPADATLLPESSIQAHLFPRGEEDWYRFHLPEGGTVHIALT
ncbi:MAG: hypothetical protein D6766_11605, partial [Verrucomicrobia bacterium]